ncbi:flagellar export chaperone FliS [Anaerobacillus sp. CMMVII]|uniref:flagellar export chaperone FliS n=1 Tax=Anaerobacillus sp. CMMVII TaxID=2755588 RepID=UPI0021B754B1|nr:flagellar export chaperone FliS [Anaerobacillus sp. CMMVII]MCT8140158.1 flagellar export chaperone FliS [Anaerobacillus sp. CMMVII]
MSIPNPYATAYKNNTTATASPGELTLMLYNGCLKFIKQTRMAIEKGDIQAKNTNIIKAQNIIRELMVTLKTDNEIGKEMMRMYDFILGRLIDANTKSDLVALAEAEQFVVEFRDTWKQVVQLDRQKRHGQGGKA